MAKKKSYTQQIRDLFEQGKSAENIVTTLGVPSQQVHNVRWHLKNKATKEKLDLYQESIVSALASMHIEMAEDFYYRRLHLHKLVISSLPHNPEFMEVSDSEFVELSDPTLYRIDLAIKQDIESRAEWRLLNRPEWPPVKWPY
jgi:hypothetical protein